MKWTRFRPRIETLEDRDLLSNFFAVGGSPGRVAIFTTEGGPALAEFQPFGASYVGSVSVAVGDVNGDGVPDLVVGGATDNPEVRVYDGQAFANGTFDAENPDASLLTHFFAYNPAFHVGISVAVGDINGNGFADIVTGPTAGNPHVKVFSGQAIANGSFDPANPDANLVTAFFAYGLQFNVGANVAVGDVSHDGFADIVTGATAGNPHVKVYDGRAIASGSFNATYPDASLTASFFAYGLQFNVGANVAVGDVNGDGFADLITGATAGNPHVKVYDGKALAENNYDPANLDASLLTNFFAFDTQLNTGARVAAADFNDTGSAALFVGNSQGPPRYRVFAGDASGFNPAAQFEGDLPDFRGDIWVGA